MEFDPVDSAHQAMLTWIWVAAPMLAVTLIIGLAAGILQAMTQIHDVALSFVPKLVVVLLVAALLMPWLVDVMVDYSRQTIEEASHTVQRY